jgi:hypothetical protein
VSVHKRRACGVPLLMQAMVKKLYDSYRRRCETYILERVINHVDRRSNYNLLVSSHATYSISDIKAFPRRLAATMTRRGLSGSSIGFCLLTVYRTNVLWLAYYALQNRSSHSPARLLLVTVNLMYCSSFYAIFTNYAGMHAALKRDSQASSRRNLL